MIQRLLLFALKTRGCGVSRILRCNVMETGQFHRLSFRVRISAPPPMFHNVRFKHCLFNYGSQCPTQKHCTMIQLRFTMYGKIHCNFTLRVLHGKRKYSFIRAGSLICEIRSNFLILAHLPSVEGVFGNVLYVIRRFLFCSKRVGFDLFRYTHYAVEYNGSG